MEPSRCNNSVIFFFFFYLNFHHCITTREGQKCHANGVGALVFGIVDEPLYNLALDEL